MIPECFGGGPIGKVGALGDPDKWARRIISTYDIASQYGVNRELFAVFRASITTAEKGGRTFDL